MNKDGDENTTNSKIIFSIIILSFFVSLMGWNFYNFLGYKEIFPKVGDKEFSNIMGRERMWYAGPDEGRFFSGVFQSQLEKATADHFPLGLIVIFKKFQKILNELILTTLPKNVSSLTPIGENYGTVKDGTYLVNLGHPRKLTPENYNNKLSECALYYNNIIDKVPNIKLVVMPILSKYDWLLYSEIGLFQLHAFRKYSIDTFRTLLNPKINCSVVFEKYPPNAALNFYYQTDHHFSMRGAYIAYLQLIDVFNCDTNNSIVPLKPKKWFIISDIKFHGSLSRRSGGILDIYDELEDAEFDLPEYSIFINENSTSEGYGKKNQYAKGLFNAEKYANHYGEYFGGDHGSIKFVNANRSNSKNLLIIGDSFDNSMAPLISSHFQNTFFVDLRHYEKQLGAPFEIIDFINSNKINSVVFIGNMDWVLISTPSEQG